MKVAVFGSGYVGLVVAACLVEVGHHVVCVDVSEEKIAQLNAGQVPIYEPGLGELIQLGLQTERLVFTTSAQQAVQHAHSIFIAVGTPQDEDGSADLQYVLAVAQSIGQYMDCEKVVINKSTVPVGTAQNVKQVIQGELDKRALSLTFQVVSNPEFLKEGSALEDFQRSDRIIIGTEDAAAERALRAIYAPFIRKKDRILVMDTASAELTKYAANALLATKISFMNEISHIAEKIGADIEHVRMGLGTDPRIGYHFIYAGCGYGGSCFGKDLRALVKTGQNLEAPLAIVQAVDSVNQKQKNKLFEKIEHYFEGNLKDKVIAVWGLAFKPGTDDMRDAPSRVTLERLCAAGAKVQVYDPQAMKEAQRIYGEHPSMQYCALPMEACEGADALVIHTEWREFRAPDFVKMKALLRHPVIFDGRNLYALEQLTALGIQYFGIGRSNV